ncbi:MAG: hypothetical protein G01um10148_300 [Parcubacteria group bacterium Gr01-1014_8]|nr:MAG: hypothetical protein G01um10148_300 [Parcubacteria group bacterium Gr01-1014_8]
MRILVVYPRAVPEIEIFFNDLKQAGHEIVYWVGEHSGEKNTPKGAIFHDHYDAWDGKSAEVFKNVTFPPASSELVERLYRTESVVLSMMDKHYDSAPVNERKHIYYSMLSYWSGVLDMLKPDAVVFAIVPHTVYNYILYELARLRGLFTPCFEDTYVASRLLFYKNFWEGSEELRDALGRASDAKLSDLSGDLAAYLKRFKETEAQPAYMAQQKRLGAGWGLFRHRVRIARAGLLSGRTFVLAWRFFKRLFVRNLAHEYRGVVSAPDMSRPYVYFPLNMQPERSTSPQGGVFQDQILVAETVAASLPDGWMLVIKEHPSQWWLRGKTRYSSARYRGYYQRLARIPNTVLVDTFTNTFELTRGARAVAVVTGTPGWEAILRSIPVIVFGYPWYRDCPGTLRVENVDECRVALARIESGGLKLTTDGVIAFLKALDAVSVRAFIHDLIGQTEHMSEAESFRNIALKLNTELRANT